MRTLLRRLLRIRRRRLRVVPALNGRSALSTIRPPGILSLLSILGLLWICRRGLLRICRKRSLGLKENDAVASQRCEDAPVGLASVDESLNLHALSGCKGIEERHLLTGELYEDRIGMNLTVALP